MTAAFDFLDIFVRYDAARLWLPFTISMISQFQDLLATHFSPAIRRFPIGRQIAIQMYADSPRGL